MATVKPRSHKTERQQQQRQVREQREAQQEREDRAEHEADRVMTMGHRRGLISLIFWCDSAPHCKPFARQNAG
jgi:hypothetical protein